MKTKKAFRVALSLLGVFLLFYFAYQVYMFVSPSYKTEIARLVTESDSVTASGIVARDETLVDVGSGSIAAYRAQDGEKIASGAAVADIYPSAGEAMNALRYERLSALEGALERASDTGRTAGSNLENLRSRIYKSLSSLSGELAADDYPGAFEGSLELLELLSSYDTASGGAIDYSAALAETRARLAELGSGDFSSSPIYTPVEGYFISGVDGYESALDSATVLEASANDIIALIEGEAPALPGEGCKVVSEYEWYFAAALRAETAARMSVGDELQVDFSYSLSDALPMRVARVAEGGSDGRTAVVFECNRLNASLCSLRVETARINFRAYSGIKVARSALRLLDGELGVYIKYGSAVDFRKVDVIYETDDYIISSPGESSSGTLAVYDEMITEGRDLEVGKQLGRVNV